MRDVADPAAGRAAPTSRPAPCPDPRAARPTSAACRWTPADLLLSPQRLTTPLVRLGKGGPLLPATWDEAFDAAVAGLRAAQEFGGPDAVAVFGGGGLTNEKAYAVGTFARVALRTSQVDDDGRWCTSSAAAGANKACGLDRGLPFPLSDLDTAGCVLPVGSNMAETMPPCLAHLARQREAGGALVVVDPRRAVRMLVGAGTAMVLTARGAEQHSHASTPSCRSPTSRSPSACPAAPARAGARPTGQGDGQGGREHGQKADRAADRLARLPRRRRPRAVRDRRARRRRPVDRAVGRGVRDDDEPGGPRAAARPRPHPAARRLHRPRRPRRAARLDRYLFDRRRPSERSGPEGPAAVAAPERSRDRPGLPKALT